MVLGGKSNFQGERGGDAYDAELLALLRGLSAKTGAADRFTDGEEEGSCVGIIEAELQQSQSKQSQQTTADKSTEITQGTFSTNEDSNMIAPPRRQTSRDRNVVPPWKRGKSKMTNATTGSNLLNDLEKVVDITASSPPSKRSLKFSPAPNDGENTTDIRPTTSTFQGERGGDAHDEELLALLRGVSAKSGAIDRFSGGDDDDDGDGDGDANGESNSTNIAELPEKEVPLKDKPCGLSSNHKNEVPPWKRGKAKATANKSAFDADTIVAAAKSTSLQPTLETLQETSKSSEKVMEENAHIGGIPEQNKSNFKGERGGDAHDDELLALLRGVSSNSGGADRFATEDVQSIDDNSKGEQQFNQPLFNSSKSSIQEGKKENVQKNDVVPPWKRKKTGRSKPVSDVEMMDVIVTARPNRPLEENAVQEEIPLRQDVTTDIRGNFKTESNFQGPRGGDAHDEELLALLRGVSAKSGSADRFAGDDDGDENDGIADVVQPPIAVPLNTGPKSSSLRQSICDSNQIPPWKRGKVKKCKLIDTDVVEMVVTSKPKLFSTKNPGPAMVMVEPLSQKAVIGGLGNFKNENNFQGERGGEAHDEELLALLRGVSSKSASAGRFAGGDNNHDEITDQHNNLDSKQSPPSPPSSESSSSEKISPTSGRKKKKWFSPPWKKNKKIQAKNDGKENHGVELKEVVSVTSSGKDVTPTEIVSNEILQGGGGNFKHESTFVGERGGDAHDEELLALLRGVSSKTDSVDRFSDNDQTGVQNELISFIDPKASKSSELASNEDIAPTKVDDTSPPLVLEGGSDNFKQESTFQGERGGEAHDEELLALLRGVSSKTNGSDRFSRDQEETKPELSKPPSQSTTNRPQRQPAPIQASSSGPSPFPSGGAEEDFIVTKDDLPSAFSDKNWKVRKESYIVLKDLILEAAKGSPLGSINADKIIPGLDSLIPTLLTEKNAAALEFAINAGTEYANACKGGSSEGQATAIVSALLKGNGFSSPRQSSIKAVTSLVLKIMEVGSDQSSLTSVATFLVSKGLVSKKPKVVQLSASLILEATHSFGAVLLPLAVISSTLPKVLTHSNKKIRDTGIEIVTEFCRAFGSKDPLEQVISKMQKAQVKDLDTFLAKRADPIAVKIGLRCQSGSGKKTELSAADVFAALQVGSEELEAERYAKRPIVNLIDEITKTEYASKLKLAKWSEKVGAMDIVLKCGGERPYKLAQPSVSNKYIPLISDMKGLLTHTHFAVVSKAMGVLAMLAQGVGEKLYPNLRPLLSKLLQLSKDKKLTKAVSLCLDACFGNVFSYEHLLDSDASIPDACDESKEKNKLARTLALDYLDRCVIAGTSAGPRATLTPTNAKICAKFASKKLGDSDANVRKSALHILTSLQKVEDEEIHSTVNNVIEELRQSNPRAYKSLSKDGNKKVVSSAPKTASVVAKKTNTPAQSSSSPHSKKDPSARSLPSTQKRDLLASKITTVRKPPIAETTRGNSATTNESSDEEIPTLDEALDRCNALDIPLWDELEEDEGGVLVGIKSTRWQSRLQAIKVLIEFVNTRPALDDFTELEKDSTCLLIVVKEHTKKFKESNFNIVRGILELFSALCDYHERSQCRFSKWVVLDCTALAVEKIADKKLSSQSKLLLLSLCTVYPPHVVVTSACMCVEKVRAPLAHEEFLNWMKTFCNEFGAASIGSSVQEIVPFLSSECCAKNAKVKRAAFATIGLMHVQLGPSLKAVTLASIKDPSFREDFEKIFKDHPFDPSLTCSDWPMRYLFSETSNDNANSNSDSGMKIEFPKTDLIAELPSDCLSKMGAKDGKIAWKARKAALEDVEKALKNTSGLLDTSKIRSLVDLLRAMKERLTDTQINIKPIAARLIGLILGSVEGEAQGKLGKVVYAPIMNAAMNDKRKVMHDAAMEALQNSVSIPEIKGGGLNEQSLEPFVIALTGALDESEFKSAGIAGILTLTQTFVQHLSDLEKVSSQRGESLGGRFSRVLVNALSSSKVEIRSAAESLLSECLASNVFSMQTAKKSMGRLVPAKQRSVGMIFAKISSASTIRSDSKETKETIPSKPPSGIRSVTNMSAPVPRIRSMSTQKLATRESEAYSRSPMIPTAKSRIATNAKSRVNNDELIENECSSNPLVHDRSSAGIQKSRAAMRSLTWPEYPEEPSGSALYSGLKKAWSPIIPAKSLRTLFPDRGIRMQDDVIKGFDLLRQAISMEKEWDGEVLIEQLHFILRWSVYVMSCKESAVGLTGLLDMIAELLSYLHGLKYEFSDNEIIIFAPFLFEKASVAKGRFKDTYLYLIRSIKSDILLPPKRLGPLVCVTLMESSSQAKARLLACQTCYECVEKNGLSGIGKKGVLVAAKALSNEKLPENRTALLDLMVLLVSRMHNDTQRLSKICGSSLSDKARVLIKEHMHKAPTPSKDSPAKISLSSHSSRLHRPSQSSPVSKLSMSASTRRIEDDYKNSDRTAPSVFQDELPALDLRRALRDRESPFKSNHDTPTRTSGLQPPSFSFSKPGFNRSENLFSSTLTSTTSSSSRETSVIGTTLAAPRTEQINSNLFSTSSGSDQSELLSPNTVGSSVNSGSSPIGAAASLRARLMKIRESNRAGAGSTKRSLDLNGKNVGSRATYTSDTEGLKDSQHVDGLRSRMPTSQSGSLQIGKQDNASVLKNSLEIIRKLLEKSHLIPETDEDLISCTDVLKNIHAAVSKQPNLAVMIDANSVTELREEIKEKISEIVGILTRLIAFGFCCHPKEISAGLSVPLLSVNLAGLMAIFRSSDLATFVNVDDLTILIKEAGTALLDPRLAQKSGDDVQIDEATSTQMVRAINKLAVQAATGAARENSLQALIRLQDQLSSNTDAHDNPLFNSRLSRIVTKLSTRVIKAEEGTPYPFASTNMDTETILCCLEDTLENCPEGAGATKNMVKLIVMAILRTRGESTMRKEMRDLEIDPHSSALGLLVESCASELGIGASTPPGKENESKKTDLASLVSAVVTATHGPDRKAAIDALKLYKETYGDMELKNHLDDVSPAFRSYLLNELSESPRQPSPQTSSTAMSKRIKSLRSKLIATEAAVANASSTYSPPSALPDQQHPVDVDVGIDCGVIIEPEKREEALFKPNDTKIEGKSSTNPSSNAFCERLAAVKEKRATIPLSPAPKATAGSRAAALRARLEAVKKKQTNKM